MNDTAAPGAFAIRDTVTVTSHYKWNRRDTHGRTGTVVAVYPGADPDRLGVGVLYDVKLPGFATPVPYGGDELRPAQAAAPAGVR